LWDAGGVSLRLTVTGDGTGTTGTIRLDDISVDGIPELDLSVSVRGPAPDPPPPGIGLLISGLVRNNGFEQSPGAIVDCFRKSPDPDDAADWLYHSTAKVQPMLPGDSAVVEFSIDQFDHGAVRVLLVCSSPGDIVASNDSATAVIRSAVQPHAATINEIMYDPPPGRAEYVELLNTSPYDIDLGSWRLSDNDDDTSGGRFGAEVGFLAPGELIVCSPDTSIGTDYPGIPPGTKVITGVRGLSLNNGGDLLVLRDQNGRVVDRLEYLPSWHTPALDDPAGRSLEKIDPSSPGDEAWKWGSPPDPSGGTPGRPNLLGGDIPAARSRGITCQPNPFSPDGDGFEDATIISFSTGTGAAVLRIRIFDSDGRPVRTLTRSSYVGKLSSVVWNGYDNEGNRVGIGIYVVLVEGVGGSGYDAFIAKGTVVVAGKL